VIPIENSLAGSVSEHFDLLLPRCEGGPGDTAGIRHNLIAIQEPRRRDRSLFSHPVALPLGRASCQHQEWKPLPFTTPAAEATGWNCATVTLGHRQQAAAEYYEPRFLKDIEDNPETLRGFPVRRAAESLRTGVEQDQPGFFSREPSGSLVAVSTSWPRWHESTKSSRGLCMANPGYIFYVDCQIQSSDEGSRHRGAGRHCAMGRARRTRLHSRAFRIRCRPVLKGPALAAPQKANKIDGFSPEGRPFGLHISESALAQSAPGKPWRACGSTKAKGRAKPFPFVAIR